MISQHLLSSCMKKNFNDLRSKLKNKDPQQRLYDKFHKQRLKNLNFSADFETNQIRTKLSNFIL